MACDVDVLQNIMDCLPECPTLRLIVVLPHSNRLLPAALPQPPAQGPAAAVQVHACTRTSHSRHAPPRPTRELRAN